MRSGEDLPLLGIPVAIKDVIDVRGMPTTYHSRLRLNEIAAHDAECVARLRAAGAVILGKLSTHEFAIGGPCLDLPFPPARNPWNPECHPGGSSSGAGAGLAAGFFPAAIGTDTGGSVRGPADACGVVGLKPTHGLISNAGIEPLAYTFDNVGPMTRYPEDLLPLLEVLSNRPCGDSKLTSLRGLRIGYVRQFHTENLVASPEVSRALDAAAGAFERLGASVDVVPLPPLQAFTNTVATLASIESWAIHARDLQTRPELYSARGRRRLLIGAFLTGKDYIEAQRRRHYLKDVVSRALDDADMLLVASSLHPPCSIADDAAIDNTYPFEARSPFSATGHPALNFPIGLTDTRLPIGAQLVGACHQEAALAEAARLYLAATMPGEGFHPPLD